MGAPPYTDAVTLARGVIAARRPLVLWLDYDGTLVRFAPHPNLAIPDPELISWITALGRRADVEIHLVSGRDREPFGTWFAEVPVHLHAEHGLWSRAPGVPAWTRHLPELTGWQDRVRALLTEFVTATPRAWIEEKSATLVWHYRPVEKPLGPEQAARLLQRLATEAADLPIDVLHGFEVIEVRQRGISKVLAVATRSATIADDVLHVAIGDDRADEAMFSAVCAPATGGHDAVTIRIGPADTCARHRLPDLTAARAFVAALAADSSIERDDHRA